MAQVGMSTPRGSLRITGKNEAVSVSNSGTTQLLEIVTEAIEKVTFQVDNTVQALAAFIVQGRAHPDASYFTIANSAGDFSAPSGRILSANGALVTLAAAASGRFDLDTSGLYSVKITATGGNATPSVVSIYAGGSQAGQSNANVAVTAGDIEIGAVELKDAGSDVRASIVAANTARTTATIVVATQPIDAAGNVLGRTAANTARTTGTLVTPVQLVDAAGGVGKIIVDQTTDGTTNRVVVGGAPRIVATKTRPADATQYTAGDNVAETATATPLTFTLTRNSGRITGCRCTVTPASGNLVITALDFDLLLFRPATNIPFTAGAYPADNAAMAITSAAYQDLVGTFRFSSAMWRNTLGAVTAGVVGYQSQCLNSTRALAPFNTVGLTGVGTLLGVIQILSAWNPGNVANQFDFALDVDLD